VKLGPEESVLGNGRGRIMDPAQAIGCLAKRFATLGGTLLLDTALESLVTRDGAVCGVRAVRDGRPVELLSRAVILATGGFQGNPELLARYVLRDPDNLILRANSWSTGDGFIAATEAGAAVSAGIDTFYGHALTMAPARYSPLQFRDASQYYGQSSVALNLNGERFCDESEGNGEEIINQHLAQQPKGRGFYIIDQDVLDSVPTQGAEVVPKIIVDRARSFGAPIVEAATIEELCRGLVQLGVPEAIALRSLQEFNALVSAGRADELKPRRLRRRKSLDAPPFYAVGVQAAVTFTMGGIRVDERTRVLRRAGSTSAMAKTPESRAFMETDGGVLSIGSDYRQTPIRGLFAAGCDAGNISHFGYMGGLAPALTTGLTAGREAARTTTKAL
jgi:succinate dehydrogenase/fumarate reductase flavoprotein subunit